MSTTPTPGSQPGELAPGTHYIVVHADVDGMPVPVIDGRRNPDYQFNAYGDAQNTHVDIKTKPDDYIDDLDVKPNDLIVEVHTYTV